MNYNTPLFTKPIKCRLTLLNCQKLQEGFKTKTVELKIATDAFNRLERKVISLEESLGVKENIIERQAEEIKQIESDYLKMRQDIKDFEIIHEDIKKQRDTSWIKVDTLKGVLRTLASGGEK